MPNLFEMIWNCAAGDSLWSYLFFAVLGGAIGSFIAAYMKERPHLVAMYQDEKLLERMWDKKVDEIKASVHDWKQRKKQQLVNTLCFWRRFK